MRVKEFICWGKYEAAVRKQITNIGSIFADNRMISPSDQIKFAKAPGELLVFEVNKAYLCFNLIQSVAVKAISKEKRIRL